jgi:hypothetical protein
MKKISQRVLRFSFELQWRKISLDCPAATAEEDITDKSFGKKSLSH